MKKLYIIGLLALGVASCKPNLKPSQPNTGSIDLTRYLAVGNSLTAGYSDGSLYRAGQENSYPAILSKQFNTITKSTFVQPLLPGQYGYPYPKYIMTMRKGPCDTVASLSPILFPGALDSSTSSQNIAWQGPFNNVGIPGVRCIDYIYPGYAMLNPYAKRFFTNPAKDRPIDEAIRINPTFFTLWLGSNDVLGYATAGGGEGYADPTARLSDPAAFSIAYDSVVTILRRTGAEGVLINIPDVTSIPFFTTIRANGLSLSSSQANDLNAAYNGTNIRFNEGSGNYFVIEDQSVPLKMRQIRDGELILLSAPSDSFKCAGWGTKKPIPGKYVLTAPEVALVKDRTVQFNQIIDQQSLLTGLPVVNMYTYLQTLNSGIKYNGVNYNATFVAGGAFSLDGVHLTPRGYALVANYIIGTINNHYKSTIPFADVNSYNGVLFP